MRAHRGARRTMNKPGLGGQCFGRFQRVLAGPARAGTSIACRQVHLGSGGRRASSGCRVVGDRSPGGGDQGPGAGQDDQDQRALGLLAQHEAAERGAVGDAGRGELVAASGGQVALVGAVGAGRALEPVGCPFASVRLKSG